MVDVKSTIKRLETYQKLNPHEHGIPPGSYRGVGGRYVVHFTVNSIHYRVLTDKGVRGENIPCLVTVTPTGISVEYKGLL